MNILAKLEYSYYITKFISFNATCNINEKIVSPIRIYKYTYVSEAEILYLSRKIEKLTNANQINVHGKGYI